MTSIPPQDGGGARPFSSTPDSATSASASASRTDPAIQTSLPLPVPTGLGPSSSTSTPNRAASPNLNSPISQQRARPKPPRPSRCYSLEMLERDPLYRPRAAPGLETMPEVPPPLNNLGGEGGAERAVGSLDSPNAHPAPAQHSPTAPTFPPIQTRGRAHTVSVTMPQQRELKFRHMQMPLDNVRASASMDRERDEAGSTISVRMSLDDERNGRRGGRRSSVTQGADERGELNDDAVGLLDCVDREVSTCESKR